MSAPLFGAWLTIQGILFISILAAVLSGIIFLNIWYLVLAIGLFAIHIGGCLLATAVWELLNLIGQETVRIRIDRNLHLPARLQLPLRLPRLLQTRSRCPQTRREDRRLQSQSYSNTPSQ